MAKIILVRTSILKVKYGKENGKKRITKRIRQMCTSEIFFTIKRSWIEKGEHKRPKNLNDTSLL
jgi:hypothetical protein